MNKSKENYFASIFGKPLAAILATIFLLLLMLIPVALFDLIVAFATCVSSGNWFAFFSGFWAGFKYPLVGVSILSALIGIPYGICNELEFD